MVAPKAMSFQFKANKTIYSATIHFAKKNFVPIDGENPLAWSANIIPIEIGEHLCYFWLVTLKKLPSFLFSGLNGGQGKGTAVLWYADTSDNLLSVMPEHLSNFILTPAEIKPDNRLTLMFTEKEATSVAIAGGKGSSISLLSSIHQKSYVDDKFVEFVVPQGFVVCVTAFDLQVKRNANLAQLIKSVRDVAYGIVDGQLNDHCER